MKVKQEKGQRGELCIKHKTLDATIQNSAVNVAQGIVDWVLMENAVRNPTQNNFTDSHPLPGVFQQHVHVPSVYFTTVTVKDAGQLTVIKEMLALQAGDYSEQTRLSSKRELFPFSN